MMIEPLQAEATVNAPAAGGAWLTLALDEIDYGTVLVDAARRIVHANRQAQIELARAEIVRREGEQVRAARDQDAPALDAAIDAALLRGLRRIVVLGGPQRRSGVSVVPLPRRGASDRAAVMLITERGEVCERLSVQWFAINHGLTPAESGVLHGLCTGARPAEVAQRHGVSITTVRTQINTIRQKTGASSMTGLIRSLARLPPLVGALRLLADPV